MAKIWLILVSFTVIWKPQTQATIDSTLVETAANNFGNSMHGISIQFSGRDFLKQAFENDSASLTVKKINGTKMVLDIAEKIENMLNNKVEAVEKLVDAAEQANLAHEYNESIEYKYFNALQINQKTEDGQYLPLGGNFTLTPDDHFNDDVNLTQSTVQVPTNVYNMGTEVLNHIQFTAELDQQFVENYADDPTLTWQYFGSKTGFFRNFPGIKWNIGEDPFDTFDCRKRGWYISAATSPKDIVILIDKSGSMLGILLEIAKHTARVIIDTLGDDDFFNVLAFNETTSYTEPCFEDNDMLVQANANNRELIKESLDNLKAGGLAEFGVGLTDAFELLLKYNETTSESECNQAIIVITDGASKTHDDIFERYNEDQRVRVFTYLMGREVGGAPAVKKMACNNKGYYTQIATIADVDENVSKYIHVLSRPMVIKEIYNTAWTSVYMDSAASDDTLALMTTVAQPVFNKKNDTKKQGILLGVVGVDVPVHELLKLTPVYKLGARGYPFAITNNGYILFHPDLRPKWGNETKPNYNSVDLAEVELSDANDTIRNAMINTETGEMTIQVVMHTSNLTRVSVRNNTYFYTFLDDTPFSFAIVLVEPYGFYIVESDAPYFTLNADDEYAPELDKLYGDFAEGIERNATLFRIAIEGNFFDGNLTIARRWPYCSWTTEENKEERKDSLVTRLFHAVLESKLDEDCDADMINHLLFDVKITENMPEYWKSVYSDENYSGYFCYPGPPSSSSSNLTTPTLSSVVTEAWDRMTPVSQNKTEIRSARSASEENIVCVKINNHSATENGILMSFLGTRGGLSRWYNNPDFENVDDFIKSKSETIEEDYYWRAVELGDDRILYSVPLLTNGYVRDPNSTLKVTASTILTFTKDDIGPTVVAALGYQMLWSSFATNLVGNTICDNENVDCLLLDENAYIMFSEDENEVGQHFGKAYLRLMTELVNVSVYEKFTLVDYQGMCSETEKFSSAGSTILDPFFSLTTLVAWWFHQVVIFLVQFSIQDWWYSTGVEAECKPT
ncbi:voltage-dependent calcium channel subunit alpha-2/delta-3-like isoform X2 [Anneissia japonica]|uniref:voltage-dependent calcium channel subunit alpha-2/delta-3-like isoform X2 n=1 Tax=Anneissia japonica TaxID=1529436 RepID=UPI00142584CD|nr:voltage-dependent calcium channel subunit alpha-2/delta-3-like isoform X2 [Anneissia japonica]